MTGRIVVGSRGSKLALLQAQSVVAMVKDAAPHVEVSLKRIATAGDRDRHTQLDNIGVAVFVKELEQALLDRTIDLAVHSLKDLPTEMPHGLCLLAVTERLDPRDALVSRSKLAELGSGSTVGTGSLRRSVQLSRLRPDLQVRGIRGNVDTRLSKVSSGEIDAVIVAVAGLLRLGWEEKIAEYLSLEHFLPAVGQGTLAIEARSDDAEAVQVASLLNHLPTWQCATAERAFLQAVGGGCRAPIAALGAVHGSILTLEGMVAGPRGGEMLRVSETGSAFSPDNVGRSLAQRMLTLGASRFLAEVRGG